MEIPDPDEFPTPERYGACSDLAELEWEQFQKVNSDGGRAECQGNWPVFDQMRLAQFLTWPAELIAAYGSDLLRARSVGRNLVMEKYARMMVTTEPERYARELAPYLPALNDERIALQERIIAIQVAWADEFRAHFPKLGAAMRKLRTAQDVIGDTSFETYLRGELCTYSEPTLAAYAEFVDLMRANGLNLTQVTVQWAVRLGGDETLDQAEATQRA
ncbi:DUF4125 family protein [Rarobacter incanus]|uniref:Uncharacterized protein DUF4125 n=1 Tax=Rarobacter incanus TaxID=153494 RepID=A0A542SRC0_9MICO|nr:DUF4125 family protein [Rarobacter incanus]TQK76757.1 uncharacterized protein DUF4125 [Rarobacter incanus]